MSLKKPLYFFITFLFLLSVTSPVIATTIKFYDESLTGPNTLVVYNTTGEYIGEFNTTSTIVFSDSGLIVHVIPTREDLLKDPESLFDATIAFVSDNFVYLFGCGAIIGFLFWRR